MPLHIIAFGFQKRVFCTDLFRIENAKQVLAGAAMHTAATAAVSSYRCNSLPWSKRPNDQSLGLGLKKMWLVVAWLVAKISGIATQRIPPLVPDCVWCCLLYTSPSPRDGLLSRMPSSA